MRERERRPPSLTQSPCPTGDLHDLLAAAIAPDPPATLDKGGVIRKGYSAELDGIAVAAKDAKKWVAGLERSERESAPASSR